MDTQDPKLRTPGQIRQQLKQVLFRHLQRMLRANFKQTPDSCQHHRNESLGDTGVKVGVCRWESSNKEDMRASPRGRVCDARIFGCNAIATTCKWWTPLRTKEEIKAEFRALISSPDRGRIAAAFPDVAALMWVLDGEADIAEALLDAEAQADPPEVVG